MSTELIKGPSESDLISNFDTWEGMAPEMKSTMIIPNLYLGILNEAENNDYKLIIKASVIEVHDSLKNIETFQIPPTEKIGETATGKPDVNLESFQIYNQLYFKKAVQMIEDYRSKGENVFVGCQQGKDRSALIVVAYIMKKFNLSVDDAIEYVKGRRQIVSIKNAGGGTYYNFLKNEYKS